MPPRKDAEPDRQPDSEWMAGEVKWSPFKARIVGDVMDCGHSQFVIELFRKYSWKGYEQIATIHESDVERFVALMRESQDKIRLIRAEETMDR